MIFSVCSFCSQRVLESQFLLDQVLKGVVMKRGLGSYPQMCYGYCGGCSCSESVLWSPWRHPPVSQHPDGGGGVLSQQVGHLVQTETGHLLSVHFQDLISNRQQAGIQLLSAAVHHVLHVYTYSTRYYSVNTLLTQYFNTVLICCSYSISIINKPPIRQNKLFINL